MKYKYAVTPSEKQNLSDELKALVDARPHLQLKEWGATYVDADPQQIGLAGSPTKVKAVENVVFTAKESLRLENNDEQIENLVKELITNHTIG
jgi:electron transfer flavoprotein beta subunit